MSYEVSVHSIETRKRKNVVRYRVRWTVAGKRFEETFTTKGLADSWRSTLVTATRHGEAFSEQTGLPESFERKHRDVTFWDHCLEFTTAQWGSVSGKQRSSIVESLLCVVPVVVTGTPPDALRPALRKKLNIGGNVPPMTTEEIRAITWLERSSRPVSALADSSVAADVLDALASKIDGTAASPAYFSRRRRVVHRCLAYAVRKKRLASNPLSTSARPEGWTPPPAPDETLDPRSIGSPELVEGMITACAKIGKTQGPRFQAFFGCMYFALMRPSEVAALTVSSCDLPEEGWGWLSFADASPTAGKAYTDDGSAHEHRGLKGRTRGRPATRGRKPTRKTPAPPELVAMIKEHIAVFGVSPEGRIFRSEQGNPINASSWWQVWAKVRAVSLTQEQIDSPLMRRPYDLRHAGVTRRLNEGVDEASVAEWAGHSVEVLRRTYHHSVSGMDDALIARMDMHRRRQ